jgi:ABC-2 type transport system ATP-binding protein
MLSVQHLRKTFSTVVAVDDVSFDVERGEIFGLIGPNGAGKTTTIRAILNILLPDAGLITFEGRPFDETTRNMVGYLPEERGLYRKSRLLDMILYFSDLRGMPRTEAKREAIRWLERFGLADRAGRKVEELSKGNQQKVQFITSVIHKPPLLILDEPFAGLDPVNQLLFQEVFQEQRQEGRAIIFSTHQMDQAERLSDSLCLINRGRVVLGGSVREVKQRYGTNTLHIEFEGDAEFVRSAPGVRRAIVYANAAELDLEPSVAVSSIIGEVNGRLNLRKLELREPSLQSIFLQVVGEPIEAGGAVS